MCSCSTAAPSCSLCLCIPFLVAWEFSIQQWCKDRQQGTVWSRTSSGPRLRTESSGFGFMDFNKNQEAQNLTTVKIREGERKFSV